VSKERKYMHIENDEIVYLQLFINCVSCFYKYGNKLELLCVYPSHILPNHYDFTIICVILYILTSQS